jgi:hypothetical protein
MRILDWETGSRDELAEFISTLLVAGFWQYDDVLEWVLAWVDDSGVVPPDSATALLESMWNARVTEQASWTNTGDYGRLQRTFDHLESEGILARMCFSCCTQCATREIDDERTPNPDPDDWYRYREWAYTFFHEQDAQALGEPNPSVYLGYSAFRAHPALPQSLIAAAGRGEPEAQREVREQTDTMVGQRVVQLARHFGLEPQWSGSPSSRILLTMNDWRKPLPR